MKGWVDEMDKDIGEAIMHNSVIDIIHGGFIGVNSEGIARELYDEGYRKQAWISVEERVPKLREKCLCYYPQKDYGSKVVVDYAETDRGYFGEQYKFGAPSHWMPLPEPPKGE